MKIHFYQGALIALIVSVAGCSSTMPHDRAAASVEESSHTDAGWQKKTLPESKVTDLLTGLAPHAAMANASYRNDISSAKDRLTHGCDYVTSSDAKTLTLDLPSGWQRLDNATMKELNFPKDKLPIQPCLSGEGLDYETYIHRNAAGNVFEAVISFRGTENTKFQWREDWIANFSNIDFGLGTNKQFEQTRVQGDRLVKALAAVLPKVESTSVCKATKPQDTNAQVPIDLVGHSLGGGLAQHLAYYSQACDVRKTVTFDTSPANGWFYLKQRGEIQNRDPIIERVYMHGEWLSYIRKISTQFNMVRNNRIDYRIEFADFKGNPVHMHSIYQFSKNISDNARMQLDDVPDTITEAEAKTIYSDVAGMSGAY